MNGSFAKRVALGVLTMGLIFNVLFKVKAEAVEINSIANLSLFENNVLEVTNEPMGEKQKISLRFTGSSAVSAAVGEDKTIVFLLPDEIFQLIESKSDIKFSYSVPRITLLGIDLLPKKGDFSENEIHIDPATKTISANFSQLVSLSLLSKSSSRFTLEITVDEIPLPQNGSYIFYSAATDGLIDLRLLGIGNKYAEGVLIPNEPTIFPPILYSFYTTDKEITGTGRANSSIIIEIKGNEFEGIVDENGNFTVLIPYTYPAGTEIQARVKAFDIESKPTIAYVLERPEPPKLEEIYSNDRFIRGDLPPSATSESEIIVSIDEESYVAEITEAQFQLTLGEQLEVGTEVKAIHVVDGQHQSLPDIEYVQEAYLSLQSVPENIEFENITIGTKQAMAYSKNTTAFTIRDTRGPGNQWQLLASINRPLTSTINESHVLPGVLGFTRRDGNFIPFSTDKVSVYQGTTVSHDPLIIEWSNPYGLTIHIEDTAAVYAEKYSTIITWTLQDVP